jgi:hypothetical protein
MFRAILLVAAVGLASAYTCVNDPSTLFVNTS